jgi:exodeoxyribonuclease-3
METSLMAMSTLTNNHERQQDELVLATWNIDSIRCRLDLVTRWLRSARPDVLLLQETKCPDEAFPIAELTQLGYHVEYYGQKAYNGVAIISRTPITSVIRGLPTLPDPDRLQTRYIEATIDNIRIGCVYAPNGHQPDSDKFVYKQAFYHALHAHIAATSPALAIIAGDFNVAPTDRDVANPQQQEGRCLCTDIEREWFQAILDLRYIDTLRLFHHNDKGPYTCWERPRHPYFRSSPFTRDEGFRLDRYFRSSPFTRDEGFRLDHILVSKDLQDLPTNANVDRHYGCMHNASDHAPVWMSMKKP